MNIFQNKLIAEMRPDDAIEGHFDAKSLGCKMTNSGKPFLSGVIADKSKEAPCVLWGYDPETKIAEQCSGKIVWLRGNVSEYQGSVQVVLTEIRPLADGEQYDKSRLAPVAPIDDKAARQRLNELISSIEDKEIRDFCKEIAKRFGQVIVELPAAKKMHHAFIHGLLMHVRYMMEMANFVGQLYGRVVNRDLLIAGALAHDVAKGYEFVTNELGIVTDYSVPGCLLGHLYMGAKEVEKICSELGISEEKSLLLQHMVLSHHGKPEFGACVRPQTAEAVALNFIDDFDAKMEMFRELYEQQPAGTMSEKAVFGLDARIYHPNI